MADKKNSFTDSTEQNLPVPGNSGNIELVSARSARAVQALTSAAKADSTSSAAPDSSSVPSSAAVETHAAAAWPSVAPMRTLERAHDLMSLHAFRLRDSGADSLQVVIKPGSNLQLSLNLQMRDGQVQMEARLHKGDYDFLNRQWPQLQQQLEARGIRLAPLSADTGSLNSQSDFQQTRQQRQDEDPTALSVLGGLPISATLAPAAAPSASAPASPVRGWETWA